MLQKILEANPGIKPAQLHTGATLLGDCSDILNRDNILKPASEIWAGGHNKDRLAYVMRELNRSSDNVFLAFPNDLLHQLCFHDFLGTCGRELDD